MVSYLWWSFLFALRHIRRSPCYNWNGVLPINEILGNLASKSRSPCYNWNGVLHDTLTTQMYDTLVAVPAIIGMVSYQTIDAQEKEVLESRSPCYNWNGVLPLPFGNML